MKRFYFGRIGCGNLVAFSLLGVFLLCLLSCSGLLYSVYTQIENQGKESAAVVSNIFGGTPNGFDSYGCNIGNGSLGILHNLSGGTHFFVITPIRDSYFKDKAKYDAQTLTGILERVDKRVGKKFASEERTSQQIRLGYKFYSVDFDRLEILGPMTVHHKERTFEASKGFLIDEFDQFSPALFLYYPDDKTHSTLVVASDFTMRTDAVDESIFETYQHDLERMISGTRLSTNGEAVTDPQPQNSQPVKSK